MKNISKNGCVKYLNPDPVEVINHNCEGSLWYESQKQPFPAILWPSGATALDDPNDRFYYTLHPDGRKVKESHPSSPPGTSGGR